MTGLRGPSPTGVLLVDKPQGPTSHDVVARLRRALKTREVGHAGTLDPMATGLLVVLAGEATKLAPYLTADDKVYLTTVHLGVTTLSLDADGEGREEAPVPEAIVAELRAFPSATGPRITMALDAECQRTAQIPPMVSAVHVDGKRAHARARAGEVLDLPPRPVRVLALDLVGTTAEPPALTLRVAAAKGYYVRALGRDLATHLGTVGHLTSLRRIAAGAFTETEATSLEEHLQSPRLLSLEEAACRALPTITLTERGTHDARHGRPVADDDMGPPRGSPSTMARWTASEGQTPAAWLDETGRLVAVGTRTSTGVGQVLRGFTSSRTSAPSPS